MRKVTKVQESRLDIPESRPALTIEARQSQMISLATNEAERRIRDGTASSQIICHYLDLGTTLARLKEKEIEQKCKYMEAKQKSYESMANMEEIASNALTALQSYRQGYFFQGDTDADVQ